MMKAINIPPNLLITTKYVFLHTNCSSKSADGTDFLRFYILYFQYDFTHPPSLSNPSKPSVGII